MSYLKYKDDYNFLNQKEIALLKKATIEVERFVRKSRRISNTSYATRDAHAKSYSYLEGSFYPELDEIFGIKFKNKTYSVLARMSHANLKVSKASRQIPLYGLAMKISTDNSQEINYPLVNFPVFITNSVSRFLNIFINVNKLFTANWLSKPKALFQLLFSSLSIVPETFNLSFFQTVKQWLTTYRNFILNRDYHSIGAYRFGDGMVKVKMLADENNTIKRLGETVSEDIEMAIERAEIIYHLFLEVADDADKHPINVLTKQWEKPAEIYLGKVIFNSTIVDGLSKLEHLTFNPFYNPENLKPVGKIQRLRDAAYTSSIKLRHSMNDKT